MTDATIAIPPVPDDPETDPVFEHYAARVRMILEEVPSGAAQFSQIMSLIWEHEENHRTRESGWRASTNRSMQVVRWQDSMLTQTRASLSRQVELTTRVQAQLARRDSVDTVLTDMASELQATDPEFAQRMVEVLAVPAAPAMPRGPVVLAFATDTRFTSGWFNRKLPGGGMGGEVVLPFVGWSMVPASDPRFVEQAVEPTFLYGGRAHPTSSLDAMGLVFHHAE